MSNDSTPPGAEVVFDLDFTSDRLRLLRPFITQHAIYLGVMRVVDRDFRIIRRTRKGGKEVIESAEGTDIERKIALIIAKELNPQQVFSTEEDAILYGVCPKKMGAIRARQGLGED